MNGTEETKIITLGELYNLCNTRSTVILAKSGFDGRILCKRFNPKKHAHLAQREVTAMWAGVEKVSDSFVRPIIECYLYGAPEYEQKYGRNEG